MPVFSPETINAPKWLKHDRLREWVASIATLTQPERIHWADGTQQEYDALCSAMVDSGVLVRLKASKSNRVRWTTSFMQ